MSKSSIEWTESTWNPIVGCTKVSAGCKNCYAERMACRLRYMMQSPQYLGVTNDNGWNGKTEFVESALQNPLKRKKATTYFVCSMSDLFHETVPFKWIDKVFAVMALCPQHTFQVLTKRPERMARYLDNYLLRVKFMQDIAAAMTLPHNDFIYTPEKTGVYNFTIPFPNVWLGTTAEDQAMADKRIPELLKCPAAKRFVSVEPMLGPVDLQYPCFNGSDSLHALEGIDWVICGGESGPGARPMHPDRARSVRDQCKAAGVPFFFKQWGKHLPESQYQSMDEESWRKIDGEGIRPSMCGRGDLKCWPLGKKKAGSLLDGVEHKEYPK